MEIEEQDKQLNIAQLINIVQSYYSLEKEKINFLMNQQNIFFSNEIQYYYLVEKSIMDKIKYFIHYEKIKEKIKTNLNEKEEEIINNYYTNNTIDFKIFSSESNIIQNDDENVLKELLENKNFPYEIINEEVKNSINFIKYEFLKVNGRFANNKICFELNSQINNKKLIIVLFNIGNNYLLQLFYIFNYPMNVDLLEIIDKTQYNDILKSMGKDINNINEEGELKYFNQGNYCYSLLIKKIKMDDRISFIKNKDENPINENIKTMFDSLYRSNKKYENALSNPEEIRGNYSPCKLINFEWVKNLKNIFGYKENNDGFYYNENYDKNYLGIFKNYKNLYPKNIENGEFFVSFEIFFLSLYPFFNELENLQESFNYQIFLKNNKGAVIIKKEIYAFETINNDVNQRKNFQKIIINKEELKQKMLQDSFDFDLSRNDYDELFNIYKKNLDNNHQPNNIILLKILIISIIILITI